MREKTNAYKILVGKPEGRRWEDDIKTDLRAIRMKGVGWIHLTQYRTDGGLL
jgi:hypothetical protein